MSKFNPFMDGASPHCYLLQKSLGEKYLSSIGHFANSLPLTVAIYNLQTGVYRFISPEIENLIGYSPSEIQENGGLSFIQSLMHTEDLERINEENSKAAEYIQQNPELLKSYWADFEYRLRHKEGHYIKVHTRGRAFSLDSNNEVKEILNFTFDANHTKDLNLQELGKIALHSFDHFTDTLTHKLKGHIHVLEFIVNEIIEDSIELENLTAKEIQERLRAKTLGISQVSTQLSQLVKSMR